jgi:hypothetical protein
MKSTHLLVPLIAGLAAICSSSASAITNNRIAADMSNTIPITVAKSNIHSVLQPARLLPEVKIGDKSRLGVIHSNSEDLQSERKISNFSSALASLFLLVNLTGDIMKHAKLIALISGLAICQFSSAAAVAACFGGTNNRYMTSIVGTAQPDSSATRLARFLPEVQVGDGTRHNVIHIEEENNSSDNTTEDLPT